MTGKPNHLRDETSPYLLQHAYNPVDWYPWSDYALQKATSENKLLVVSIGYAACHWCHVMEHESFEDQAVADLMNTHFVSIKVDREERPDIDQVYMDAAVMITGRGGWPLNIIALPDGSPVYGGTYFPKKDWTYVLNTIATAWQDNRENLIRDAGIIKQELADRVMSPDKESVLPDARNMFSNWLRILDMTNGGTHGAPKFPMPVNLRFLLHYGIKEKDNSALASVDLTLSKMAAGGIYDHLGGGFCRYSTDAYWKIPHFEKMLYDNAQLASLFSDAFRHSGKQEYKEVVYGIHKFIKRELTSPEGLFYSSVDADSEGREGAFYSWKSQEITRILGEKARAFMSFFNVSEDGNWENDENVLFRSSAEPVPDDIKESISILFNEREKRPKPALDNKILVSWNALMISGYISAYKTFSDDNFLEIAIKAADNLSLNYLKDDGRIIHSGNASREINGFLEDYALLINAFIDLYQTTFDLAWLHKAEKMSGHMISHFSQPGNPLFYFTSDIDKALVSRKVDTNDNVIPSSNAAMAMSLLILGYLLDNEEYKSRSLVMALQMADNIAEGPYFHALWAEMTLLLKNPPFEVSIVGKDWKKFHSEFLSHYLPDVILSGGESGEGLTILEDKAVPGKTLIYVCRSKTCSLPVESTEEALSMIKTNETV